MKYILFFFFTSTLTISCGGNKVLSPKEAEGKKLILSHGGGFTGKYKTYYLLENGQLFKGGEVNGSSNAVKSMKKRVVDQIFANYTTLGLRDVDVSAYGNLNYSIIMKDENGEHKINWDKGQEGAEKLELFYRNVMNLIMLNNADSNDAPAKPTDAEEF